MPEGVSNLAVAEGAAVGRSTGFMGALGGKKSKAGVDGLYGAQGNAYGAGGVAMAPPPPPMAAPATAARPRAAAKHEIADSPLEAELAEDKAPAKSARASDEESRKEAALTWSVRLDRTAGVRDAGPLVTAIRTALAKRADLGGGTARVRLTVDAHGKIVGVEVVGGDKAFGARLKPTLLTLSSASVSTSSANGTVELTIRRG
jgi:hypothetical protein